MKVAIYYRVSTDQQDVDMQVNAVSDWMAGKNITVVETISETGVSGKDNTRPGLARILELANNGSIDNVIVYKLDRFSRDSNTAIMRILELDKLGVGFVSVSQPALNLGTDNPFRRTFIAIFADLAQIERETIVARVKQGLAAARARGVKLGPKPKFNTEHINSIVSRFNSGERIESICVSMGVSRSRAYAIIKGKS